MTDLTTAAIALDREASLKFNWGEFVYGVVETVANLSLKGWVDGGVSGLGALAKTLGAISSDTPVGTRAWSLIALSFAWSLDQIKSDSLIDQASLKSFMHSALQEAKVRVDKGDQFIDRDFLQNPSTASLFAILCESVISGKDSYGLGSLPDKEIESRLISLFNEAVFFVWSRNTSTFQPIADIFEIPVIGALENELGWKSYRFSLHAAFHTRPTFGQELSRVSLASLYIPLRGFWREESEAKHDSDTTYPPISAQLVNIEDELVDFATNCTDPEDQIRLVGGGPGSGKSTSLKALASKLSENSEIRPLFIPLQHIGIERELRDSINSYFTDRPGAPFRNAPLSRAAFDTRARYIFIFDGLDELVSPNERANDVINIFSARLNSLATSLSMDGLLSARFIVSGRMLAFQHAKKFLKVKSYGCIETYGYTPARRDLAEKDSRWGEDQRPTWWKKYADALNLNDSLPPALEAEELSSITHEPLLCYLLVLAGFATHNWELAADNPNRIYSALMQDVYDRGWGDGALRKKSVTAADFTLLMRTFGLAAWLGGDTRIASEAAFKETLPVTRAEAAWANFNEDNGADVTNLAINFYLKAPEGRNRGFEFTHKSFGEYLAAVAILEIALDLGGLIERRIDHAMREWTDATKTGNLTEEIFEFLQNEVRLRISGASGAVIEAFSRTKSGFERIAEYASLEGFPIDPGSNWRALERHQLNSEIAVWAIISSISRAFVEINRLDESRVPVKTVSSFGLIQLLSRSNAGFGFENIISRCVANLNVENLFCFGVSLTDLDLSRIHAKSHIFFHDITFTRCNFSMLSCRNVAVSDCKFVECNLSYLDAQDLSIESSEFTECEIDFSNVLRLTIDAPTIVASGADKFEHYEEKLFLREDEVNDSALSRSVNGAIELCNRVRSAGRSLKMYERLPPL